MRLRTRGERARVGLVALLVALVAFSVLSPRTAEANTGCPESTSSLGDITLSGTCNVDSSTTWENGTITITGDIFVNGGVTLALSDVDILFNPSFNREFGIVVSGSLTMVGGGIQSTNAYQWSFGTASGSTISIVDGDFANGRYDFGLSVADIGYSTFRDTDSTDGQHMWIGANSDFHDNVLRDISLSTDAAIVTWRNWGNTRIWGNELHLKCYGSNCMGIEVINMHEDLTSLYPGFPVVEVAWNNVTWEEIAAGTDSGSFDHEYSMRLYVHNNTQRVNPSGLAPGEAVTQPLEMGGPLDSVFENNVFYGPSKFGIYNYIYSNANNLVQYNKFYDVQWGGIFQTGGNTYRNNDFINVSDSGIWICPNGPCAGSSTPVANNFWYGNSLSYTPGATLARADSGNMFDNTMIHHGNGQVTQWEDGGLHTVYGDGAWLYWANQDIEKLEFVNTTGGTRYVRMTAGGVVYPSSFAGFGTTDDASLTIAGAIDRRGSSNYDDSGSGTFLWSLSPTLTEVDVLGIGSNTFTVANFAPNWDYGVSIWHYASSQIETQSFTTDASGQGSFSVTSTDHYRVTIDSVGTPPPQPDVSPPAQVTDLEAVVVNNDYAILQWHAPGDDGTSGQATTYDVRYSTTGPLDEANFDSAAAVPVAPPSPSIPGSTERLNVSGLSPETEYWFALRTADEVPNWSPVSNSVNATTLENATEVDDTPPSVEITSPAHGDMVSGAIDVVIEASDDTGVESVAILIDGSLEATLDTAPYEWHWYTILHSPGVHTLRAEATDTSGNTGSDEIQVAVEEPLYRPLSQPPTVESISYDPVEGLFDIRFSKSMNRASVEQALSIEPQIAYSTTWRDDSNMTVFLDEAAQSDTAYLLTIDETATDQEELTLAEAFTFGFNGVGPGGTLTVGDLWIRLAMVLAAAWVLVLGLLVWSRRGMKRLRLNIRQLATHIEELSSRPDTPEEIKVYHRY